MPATIPLSRTIDLSQRFVRNAPLLFPGLSNEPAFSNADWVRQFILSPPFAWSWNRSDKVVACVVGQQDYVVPITNFGWLEKSVILDPESGNEAHELEVSLDLAEETVENLPEFISTQIDDGAGNITFRLTPPPDKAYNLHLILQGSAPLFANTTDTWAPIPDRLRYLYDTGMLAKSYEYLNDSRFGGTMQLFLRQVIAANAGLSDTQVSLFLDHVITAQRETQGAEQTAQMGRQGRGAF